MNQKDQEKSSLNRTDRISNTQTQIRSLRATLFAYLSKYCEMQSPRWSSPEQRFRWSSSCSAQRTLSPHPWAQRGDASGQTCCRRALWRCWSLHGLVAPATTARRSRRSDAWRYRRQEGLPQHRGNIWQSENTHIQGWVGGRDYFLLLTQGYSTIWDTYADVIALYRSWPAVSQIWALIVFPSTYGTPKEIISFREHLKTRCTWKTQLAYGKLYFISSARYEPVCFS